MMDELMESVAQVYGVGRGEVGDSIKDALQYAIDKGDAEDKDFWKDLFENCDEIDVGDVIAYICVRALLANIGDNADVQQRIREGFHGIEESA